MHALAQHDTEGGRAGGRADVGGRALNLTDGVTQKKCESSRKKICHFFRHFFLKKNAVVIRPHWRIITGPGYPTRDWGVGVWLCSKPSSAEKKQEPTTTLGVP